MPFKLRSLPIIAALLALVATAVIAGFVNAGHRLQRTETMQAAAERIEQRIGNHVLALEAIRGAFTAARQVPDRQFLIDMLRSMPSQGGIGGAQGFGFALATPPEDVSEVRRRLQSDYGIDRVPFPATDQAVRYSIVMLEPDTERNHRALGYDMYHEHVRREAMQTAARTQRPAASQPVSLVQDEGPVLNGILLFVPLFASEGLRGVQSSTNVEVAGFVYAPIRVDMLVSQVMSEDPPMNVIVEVYSDRVAPENRMLGPRPGGVDPIQLPIQVADRKWILMIAAPPETLPANPAVWVGLIGLFLAGALAAFTNEHVLSVETTQRLARESQANAEQRELMLGEMQHRIKNSIARMLALFRLTARETPERDELVRLYDERLQAMARAQSLIVSGSSDARTLAEVVGEEMRQWKSTGTGVSVEGPEVALDASQVQALGLILHELSTNALKYGALGAGQPITVGWQREFADGVPIIALTWSEQAGGETQAQHVKAGSGFGSRFMRMMVEGQLGGTYDRKLSQDGLEMVIRFPERPTAT